MAGKNLDRRWKATDYMIPGQLKKLENEQAELLETFNGHLADVKTHLTQKKTVSAEGAYQCFFETYDELDENRQQQRLPLKPMYFDSFDSDTKRILEQKSKVWRVVVENVPFLWDTEIYRSELVDCRRETLRA